MIQPEIVVIRPPEHDDADAAFALELIDDVAPTATQIVLVRVQRTKAGLDRPLVFAM